MADDKDFNAFNTMQDLFAGISAPPSSGNTPPPDNGQAGQPINEVATNNPSPLSPVDSPTQEALTETAPPAVPEADLRGQLAKKDKLINDAKADIGRLKKGFDDTNARIEQLTATMAQFIQAAQQQRQQQPQMSNEEAWQNALQNPQSFEQIIDARARAVAADMLARDPRVQAGGLMLDHAAFRQEYADSPQYDPIIGDVIETFREEFPDIPMSKKQMQFGYKLADKLVRKALEAAKNQEEAARNGKQPRPNAPVQNGTGTMTADQQAQLAANAQRYRPEQGVSATAASRPPVTSRTSLQEGSRALALAMARKAGFLP